jgi:SAM-dependent methyltransferase
MPHEPDYILEIPYTSNVYPELSPTMLRQVCRLAGVHSAPLDQPFTYCDLGCGYGLTTCILAAAIPHGRFWGIDFNPEHVLRAQEIASLAGLSNVTFIEADFSLLALRPSLLPPIDYAVAHGVLSWVSPEVRADFLRALTAILKPGAVAYVSYNAMPGQALLNVLRDAMQTYTANMSGDILQRIQRGLAYLSFLQAHEAPLFSQNVLLSQCFDYIKGRDPAYLAHEYFTPHRQAFYFRDAAALMSSHGLSFIGSLPLSKNALSLCAPPAFTPTLEGARDRAQRETHADLICNTSFRRDIFIKAPPEAIAADHDTADALASETLYGTLYPRPSLGRPVPLDSTEMSFDSPIFPPILDALAQQTATAARLAADLQANLQANQPAPDPSDPPDASDSPDAITAEIGSALSWLCFGSQAVPFLSETSAPSAADIARDRFALTLPLNRQVLARQVWALSVVPLACPPAGAPLMLPFIDALMLLGVTEHGTHDLAQWALSTLRARNIHLTDDGAPITALALSQRLHTAAAQFVQHYIPKLLELQLISPADTHP